MLKSKFCLIMLAALSVGQSCWSMNYYGTNNKYYVNRNQNSCPACHSELEQDNTLTFACGHSLCEECCEKMGKSAITKQDMKCYSCRNILSRDDVAKINPGLNLRFEEAEQPVVLEKMSTHNFRDVLYRIAYTKLCPNPKCLCPIEKNSGCNHMTCKRCKHQFCWQCAKSCRSANDHSCIPNIKQDLTMQAAGIILAITSPTTRRLALVAGIAYGAYKLYQYYENKRKTQKIDLSKLELRAYQSSHRYSVLDLIIENALDQKLIPVKEKRVLLLQLFRLSEFKDLQHIHDTYECADGVFLIAQKEHQIMATGAFRRIDNTTAELRHLACIKNCNRKQLTKYMLLSLLERAQALGYEKVYFEIANSKAQSQTMAALVKLGFYEVKSPDLNLKLRFEKSLI